MDDLLHTLLFYLIAFAVVFGINVIPAFAPPTWTVLSFITIQYHTNVIVLAVVGAVASTLGRMALAKLANVIVRQKFLSPATRDNVDHLKEQLEKKTKLTIGLFLLYAFSPLPSNHLFIAYGLTGLSLKYIAIPFCLGRMVSYTFWALAASRLAHMLAYQEIKTGSIFGYYFIATQVITLLLVYVFTRIDWRALFAEKKIRWRK